MLVKDGSYRFFAGRLVNDVFEDLLGVCVGLFLGAACLIFCVCWFVGLNLLCVGH